MNREELIQMNYDRIFIRRLIKLNLINLIAAAKSAYKCKYGESYENNGG